MIPEFLTSKMDHHAAGQHPEPPLLKRTLPPNLLAGGERSKGGLERTVRWTGLNSEDLKKASRFM
jgi:hypothetical protein